MPWYFYLALKQLFPAGRRLPFFTLISVAGVGLGVGLGLGVGRALALVFRGARAGPQHVAHRASAPQGEFTAN
mgnify:CR=1 FL=1